MPIPMVVDALKAASRNTEDARHNVYTLIPHLGADDDNERGYLLEALGNLQRAHACMMEAVERFVIKERIDAESGDVESIAPENNETAPAATETASPTQHSEVNL